MSRARVDGSIRSATGMAAVRASFLAGVAAVALASGCSSAAHEGASAPDGGACGSSGEACCLGDMCSGGLACAGGFCEQGRDGETGLPCAKNGDCHSGICLPVGGGFGLGGVTGVCTTTCSSASSCVPGWSCAPKLGVASSICQCSPTREVCDGVDNDCDGIVDDEPAVNAACAAMNPLMAQCSNGACTCTASMCGSECVDLETDGANCGKCGVKCAGGEECNGGSCACPGKETACDGVCVDLRTDSNHCGACGLVCSGYCTDGRCVTTLTTTGPEPWYIALDSSFVYWADAKSGDIMEVSIDGGASTRLVSYAIIPDSAAQGMLAVDATNLYWSEYESGILAIPLAGGKATMVASGEADAIAVDDRGVFWVDDSGSVDDASLHGGPSYELVPAGPYAPSGTLAGIALDGTSVYWTDQSAGGRVMKVPLTGGEPTVLARGGQPTFIAVSGTNVVWTDLYSVLLTVPTSGGAKRTLVSDLGDCESIAVDDTSVYWTGDGVVMKVPIAGGSPTTLVSGATPAGIAVDGTSVYYLDYDEHTVMKVTPK